MTHVKRQKTGEAGQEEEKEMRVFVTSVSGKTITLSIKASDTIDTLKAKVEGSAFGVQKECQELIIADTVLVDLRKVSDYEIKHESTINLVIASTVDIKCALDTRVLQEFYLCGPGSFTKKFKTSDKIAHVRNWIRDQVREHRDGDIWLDLFDDLNLYFKGVKLENHQNISDCGINSEDCELQFLGPPFFWARLVGYLCQPIDFKK
eukprot:gnl/MRDRNA2_/MRDRNA2_167207_c0_seq1.p1 gnl/MRDRNA2_/MRDRNA2_167207_c0~~gnl/MRDRNA2_/MRDRNA2_167207_c0_seq1.p1  ORF type:complete len:230 (+),score=28.89 gnl/MRDRNA2_/MRDRNA2_167207_c0_seq1:75-692(+)